MIESKEGAVVALSDLEGDNTLKGHPGVTAYNFARPGKHCRWLLLTLDVIEENGGIEPHYHAGVDADHAYYLIDGEVVATIGDREYRLGPDSLMVFPTQTVHGFKVVSPGGAKVLRLGASDTGVVSGGNTYV